MTKKYCDCCELLLEEGDEVDDYENKLVAYIEDFDKDFLIKVGVQARIRGTWISINICKYCVIDAIKNLDDRPEKGCD